MASATNAIERHLKATQKMRALGSSGGTRSQWRALAKSFTAGQKAFSKIPGRSGEAASARRNAMRTSALANMAGGGGGKVGAKSSLSGSSAPGAMKAVPMGGGGGGRGSAGGGSASGS